MNGLEDTYFKGYRRLKDEWNHSGNTKSAAKDDNLGFEHVTSSNLDTDLSSNNFGGFSKARFSDRFGKSPDYFMFGSKDNTSEDVFNAFNDNNFKEVGTQHNLIKFSGNDVSFGRHTSYLNNQESLAVGKETSVNTFGMDAGGFKNSFFYQK